MSGDDLRARAGRERAVDVLAGRLAGLFFGRTLEAEIGGVMRGFFVLVLALTVVGCGGSSNDRCEDADGDGYGEGGACLGPDCDDGDPAVHPLGLDLAADGIDQDCSGGDVCLKDADGDHFSEFAQYVDSTDLDCADFGEATFAMPTSDCDDDDPLTYPNAPEIRGDGVDQSCDGREVCFDDLDGDGARAITAIESDDLDCDDGGEAPASAPIDCADLASADPACGGMPGATCSPLVAVDDCTLPGIDENCDGTADDDGDVYFGDADGDGFGDATVVVRACSEAAGRVEDDTDCDDRDDTAWAMQMRFPDVDADGHGAGLEVPVCEGDAVPVGYAMFGGDCAPTDTTAHPGAPELPDDGVDQDCVDGDLVMGNATGIFVAPPPSGDDGNAGTRLSPVATIEQALVLATGTKAIFVADGTYAPPGGTVTRSIFGGYDVEFTTRGSGADTHLVGENGLWLGTTPVAIERLSIDVASDASDVWGLAVNDGALTVRDVTIESTGEFNSYGVRAFGARVIADRSVIESGASAVSNGVFARGGRLVVTRSRITAQASTVQGAGCATVAAHVGFGDDAPMIVAVVGNLLRVDVVGGLSLSAGVELHSTRTRALVANNTVLLGPTDSQFSPSRLGVYLTADTFPAAVAMWNNVFTATAGPDPAAGVYSVGGRVALANNAFFFTDAGSCAVSPSGGCPTAEEIASCSFEGCISSTGNRYDDPALTGPELLLSASSVCIDAGFTPTHATALFATDRFGTTRPSGAAFDIGAHEYD